ncbi:hypothetical protein QMZ05_37875 [Bradyrhizobium sp. INPA03-11B]|uniref:hypothetical protein n=1 Tax=Bradyrhizobium sp. INPA03-11B TaxID=418598 RepID=UPI00338ECEA8
MKNLALAWLASSAAFAVAFVGWMVPWATPPAGVHVLHWADHLRLFLIVLAAALACQFVYGGLVYFVLTRTGLWRIWTVAAAYLIPVLIIHHYGIDSPGEARAIITWIAFACLVAGVSWLFARKEARASADLL